MNNKYKNKKAVIILAAIFLLIILSAFVFIYSKKQDDFGNKSTGTQNPTPSTTLDIDPEDKVQVSNGVYLAKAFNKETSKQEWAIFLNGFLRFESHGAEIDFKDLIETKRLIVLDQTRNYQMNNFYYDERSEFVYFSIVDRQKSGTLNEEVTGSIYQINTDSKEDRVLWSRKLFAADELYEDMNGMASIELVEDDKYMALSIYPCYACGPAPSVKPGLLILNIQTKKEKYLGSFGNPTFDLSTNTVTVNEYILVDETCEIGYACDTGTWQVAKPEGKKTVVDLP